MIAKEKKILITGVTGLVGSALFSALKQQGYLHVIGVGSRDYDLRDHEAVSKMFYQVKPEIIFHLAARVFGIGGNLRFKSDVLYENVMMNTHVVECARRAGVHKLVAMGSGCVYPELPGIEALAEEHVWLGPPHGSEDSYAHSKRMMLAHLNAAESQYGFKSAFAISGNIYGEHDSFDENFGHVTPALIAKFYNAKRLGTDVSVWGSGVAIRDFSHASDIALGLIHIMNNLTGPVNLASGLRHSIKDIVDILQDIVGPAVRVKWDRSKPDGQMRRYYDISKLLDTGFKPAVTLDAGVRSTYQWYVDNWPNVRMGFQ